MKPNPYEPPRDFSKGSKRTLTVWSRSAAGICALNTLASLSCFLALALIPADNPGRVGTIVILVTGYWALLGLPATTLLVLWSLVKHRQCAPRFRYCVAWCAFLLLLWIGLLGVFVLVVLSES
jgi:hypothetical protein